MTRPSGPDELQQSISGLCKRVEALAPGARTGVCLASADGAMLERAVFPSLPTSFEAAIRGIPIDSPYFGNCTAAMDGHRVITTEDFATEDRFDPRFVAHCLQHEIRSLQSRPIFAGNGRPLGTFVLGYGEPRAASGFDDALMRFAADAVTAMLQQHAV